MQIPNKNLQALLETASKSSTEGQARVSWAGPAVQNASSEAGDVKSDTKVSVSRLVTSVWRVMREKNAVSFDGAEITIDPGKDAALEKIFGPGPFQVNAHSDKTIHGDCAQLR